MNELIALLILVLPQLETPHGVKDNVAEGAIGRYQIRAIFVRDVNRILGQELYTHEDARRDGLARNMIRIYLTHYGAAYEKRTGKKVTLQKLARMFNGGPMGWRKKATSGYGMRAFIIARELKKGKNDG